MVVRVFLEGNDFAVFQNPAAHLFHFGSGDVPELSGAQLGIAEGLDEGSLHVAVLLIGEQLAEHILDDGHHGKAFGALRAPAGIDFAGMTAPEVFCVMLKKHGIELFPEAIDIEVLQRLLFPLVQDGSQIAERRR